MTCRTPLLNLNRAASLRHTPRRPRPRRSPRRRRSFVLSHLPYLVYLDYQRVPPGDVTAAKEAHQDELLEIQEREETAAHEAAAAAEKAAHAALMEEANLTGVEVGGAPTSAAAKAAGSGELPLARRLTAST